MSRDAICTIASKNYLAQVRTLAESFRRYHPDVPIHFLLVDRLDGCFEPAAEQFRVVFLEDLGIPDLAQFCFQYTILELNTAVKPFLLAHMFERAGFDRVLYFDPDVRFYAPIGELFSALEDASVVLLPHITEPLQDELRPSELDILRSGAYNLGFIGLARSPVTSRLLPWWQERLRRYCVVDPSEGLFTDQRWMDLVPAMFEGVRIIRQAGYDVAYWNLQHRRLEREQGEYRVNGEPLRFFHFSGYDPDRPGEMSKHQNRFRLADLPCVPELFEEYAQDLRRHGYEEAKRWPYAFGAFQDGTPIPDLVRRIYRGLEQQAAEFGDPFRVGPGTFFAWLNEPAEGTGTTRPLITRIALEIWKRRPDLQQAYPYPPGKDREAFASWMLTMGTKEYGLSRAFLDAMDVPETLSAGVAEEQARAVALLSERSRRARVTRAMARLGLGRMARRVLGPRLAMTIRDWVRWGRGAARAAHAAAAGPGRAGRQAIEGALGGNVVGYIHSESGVGEKARSVVRSLQAAGLPVAVTRLDIYSPHRAQDDSCAGIPDGNPYAFNILAVNADVTHETVARLGARFFRDKFNIGYWSWELERFPDEWADRFNYLEEVWVPSNFCLSAVSAASPVPVVRIPHSVHVADVAADVRQTLGLPRERFLFLFVYDYHSYGERKNPLAIVRAFRAAFGDSEEVHLVLKGTDGRADPDYHARLQAEARLPNVTLLTQYVARPVLNGLMSECDCYVSLHRSEGFGLTMAEAMYLGKPVIATAYSGNMDFMRPDNSYMVHYTMTEIEQDHGPYRKGWAWAHPDIEHAASLMQHVFQHREEALRRGERAAQHIRQHFSHEAVGALIRDRLRRLMSRYGAG